MNELMELYGEDTLDQAMIYTEELREASNFPFDTDYLEIAIGFLKLKAKEILESGEEKPLLRDLISESFGEAAIYYFQIRGGK